MDWNRLTLNVPKPCGNNRTLIGSVRTHSMSKLYTHWAIVFCYRIPSYFGTISPSAAAKSILESVRRNYPEASVPKHLLYLGHLLRVLPRKATVLIRDLLDTGVDFAWFRIQKCINETEIMHLNETLFIL